jgi:hypothetical protein
MIGGLALLLVVCVVLGPVRGALCNRTATKMAEQAKSSSAEAEWEVSRIIKHKALRAGGFQYLVEWKEGRTTWEPLSNLVDGGLMVDALAVFTQQAVALSKRVPKELTQAWKVHQAKVATLESNPKPTKDNGGPASGVQVQPPAAAVTEPLLAAQPVSPIRDARADVEEEDDVGTERWSQGRAEPRPGQNAPLPSNKQVHSHARKRIPHAFARTCQQHTTAHDTARAYLPNTIQRATT